MVDGLADFGAGGTNERGGCHDVDGFCDAADLEGDVDARILRDVDYVVGGDRVAEALLFHLNPVGSRGESGRSVVAMSVSPKVPDDAGILVHDSHGRIGNGGFGSVRDGADETARDGLAESRRQDGNEQGENLHGYPSSDKVLVSLTLTICGMQGLRRKLCGLRYADSMAPDWIAALDLSDGDLRVVLASFEETHPFHKVPAYAFRLVHRETGEDMGHLNLRVGRTPHVERYAGNIGYSVHEPFRGHRYAMRAVQLMVPVARRLGIDPIWITCDPENGASRRTLELAGAEFVEIVDVPPDCGIYKSNHPRKCRYRL